MSNPFREEEQSVFNAIEEFDQIVTGWHDGAIPPEANWPELRRLATAIVSKMRLEGLTDWADAVDFYAKHPSAHERKPVPAYPSMFRAQLVCRQISYDQIGDPQSTADVATTARRFLDILSRGRNSRGWSVWVDNKDFVSASPRWLIEAAKPLRVDVAPLISLIALASTPRDTAPLRACLEAIAVAATNSKAFPGLMDAAQEETEWWTNAKVARFLTAIGHRLAG